MEDSFRNQIGKVQMFHWNFSNVWVYCVGEEVTLDLLKYNNFGSLISNLIEVTS